MDVENEIAELQKKIIEQGDLINAVSVKKFGLRKELIEVNESLRMAEYVLSKLKVTEKIKIREFWNQKNNR